MLDKLPKHKMVLNPKSYRMAHPVYAMQDLDDIKVTHKEASGFKDKTARFLIQNVRKAFDTATGFDGKTNNDER